MIHLTVNLDNVLPLTCRAVGLAKAEGPAKEGITLGMGTDEGGQPPPPARRSRAFPDASRRTHCLRHTTTGPGSAAASQTQRLRLTLRRYLRINIAASATPGDNTAKKATLAA